MDKSDSKKNHITNYSNKENEINPKHYYNSYSKSNIKRSVSSSIKKTLTTNNSLYNFDFSKEKEMAKQYAYKEFSEIMNEYEIIKILGKGSYGIVAKVKYF
jgi:hypothetical protein